MAKRQARAGEPPELRSGVMVVTDTGMEGMVTEVLDDFPDADGGVRIACAGNGTTLVPRRVISFHDGHFLVRTDGTRSSPGATRAMGADADVVVPIVEERLVTDGDRDDAGDAECEPLEDAQHSERDHERRDPESDRDDAVDETDKGAEGEGRPEAAGAQVVLDALARVLDQRARVGIERRGERWGRSGHGSH